MSIPDPASLPPVAELGDPFGEGFGKGWSSRLFVLAPRWRRARLELETEDGYSYTVELTDNEMIHLGGDVAFEVEQVQGEPEDGWVTWVRGRTVARVNMMGLCSATARTAAAVPPPEASA